MAGIAFDLLQPTTRLIGMERCFASLLAKDYSKHRELRLQERRSDRDGRQAGSMPHVA